MSPENTHIDFIIGSEKRIAEIVSRAEMEPLLRSLVMAGPLYAAVLDEDGLPLCREGRDDLLQKVCEIRHRLLVEGEPRGTLAVGFGADSAASPDALALLARDALQLIITNNLKRMLTTEIHTSVVKDSYEQLVETNRNLANSERCYRELATSLEQKVEERTIELQKAYARMLQQEKLAAVGSLAAGMAHEINNPNGFIRSNLAAFRRYFLKLSEMLDCYQQMIDGHPDADDLRQESQRKRRELKLDFILEDTPDLLNQSLEGTDRIAAIVADMKSFSHVDESGLTDADLNEELRKTLAVLAPQILPGTAVTCDYRPLPLLGCHAGLMSQALHNIIHNALLSRPEGLELNIVTAYNEGRIEIIIADNGCGISPGNLCRVFDPFYTTRDVGSGTGMGLTVAREIIRDAGGTIHISSREGAGTRVSVRFPLDPGGYQHV